MAKPITHLLNPSEEPANWQYTASAEEEKGDLFFLSREWEEALATYRLIPEPGSLLREKLAYLAWQLGEEDPYQWLGDYLDGCTWQGLSMHLWRLFGQNRNPDRNLDISAALGLCLYILEAKTGHPDNLFDAIGLLQTQSYLAKTGTRSEELRTIQEGLKARLFAEFPGSTVAVQRRLIDLIEQGERGVALASAAHDYAKALNVNPWPLLKASILLRDEALLKIVQAIFDANAVQGDIPYLEYLYLIETHQWDHALAHPCGEEARSSETALAAIKILSAIDKGDSETITSILTQHLDQPGAVSSLNLHVSPDLPAHNYNIPGNYWERSYFELHEVAYELLDHLELIQSPTIKGRFLFFIYDGEGIVRLPDETPVLDECIKHWPHPLPRYVREASAEKPNWKALGQRIVELLQHGAGTDQYPEYEERIQYTEFPSNKTAMASYLNALVTAWKSIPEAHSIQVGKSIYDHIVYPQRVEIRDADLVSFRRMLLEPLQVLGIEYQIEYGFALHQEHENEAAFLCGKRVLASMPQGGDMSNTLGLLLCTSTRLESYEMLVFALAQTEQWLAAGNKESEWLAPLRAQARDMAQKLHAGRLHTQRYDVQLPPPLPANLPPAANKALSKLAENLAGMNAAQLLTLQAELQRLIARASDVLPHEAVDKLLAATWNGHLADQQLAPAGEQMLQRAVKNYGALVVLEALPAARAASTCPDVQLRELPSLCAVKVPTIANRQAYLIGILRNRMPYVNTQIVGRQIKAAIKNGASIEDMIGQAKEINTWSEWCRYADALCQ